MIDIYYCFPDRGTKPQNAAGEEHYWRTHRRAAELAGARWHLITSESIDVTTDGRGSFRAFVNGKEAPVDSSVFVTALYGLPQHLPDAWGQFSTFALLEAAGYYLPVLPHLSLLTNDKMATYRLVAGTGVQWLPTVRLNTGRELESRPWQERLGDLRFPLIVKPATWGGGLGIVVANNLPELRGILGLAGATCAPVVLQSLLVGRTIWDYRVYCIGGKPALTLVRKPAGGDYVANVARGGSAKYTAMPDALQAPVDRILKILGVDYLCIDFLFDGETYWFSEVELDGAIPDWEEDVAVNAFAERYRTYLARLASRTAQKG